jgi:hypothetical protein
MKLLIGVVLGALVMLCVAGGALLWTATSAGPAAAPAPLQDDADVALVLSERYLSRQVALGIPPSEQIQNPQLDLNEGNTAELSATVRVSSFITARIRVAIAFAARDGRIGITVRNVDLGSLNLPTEMIAPQLREIEQASEGELNRQLQDLEASTGLRLQSLETTEDSLKLNLSE